MRDAPASSCRDSPTERIPVAITKAKAPGGSPMTASRMRLVTIDLLKIIAVGAGAVPATARRRKRASPTAERYSTTTAGSLSPHPTSPSTRG
ncbi:UNVERIFIED_ORG: hypothetical protein EDC92_107214 [Dietzia maris]|jgi:hypothetical protein